MTTTGQEIPMPPAWQDLISALKLLARGQSNDISPFHCEHDELTVMSDPAQFTSEELEQLDTWGFFPSLDDEPVFTSYKYGSA